MASKEEMINIFFTDKGKEAITCRIKTFIRLFNDNLYPINENMLGFGQIDIRDSDEMLGRIKELSELIGFAFELLQEENGDNYHIEYKK